MEGVHEMNRAQIRKSAPKSLGLMVILCAAICTVFTFASAQTDEQEIVQVPFDSLFREVNSPLDLSFLNHRPAGRHGRVLRDGDDLVFEDGSPIRFWGVNLQANAIFETKRDEVDRHAARLARMGVNLVRIHHHDSSWVRNNIFGADALDTLTLDPTALEKIDYWIKKLQENGIYIWLDLHVGRTLTANDGVTDFQELNKERHEGDLRGYNFVNDEIENLMKRFNELYLNHVNRYTGLAYKDDPGIAFVLISNENDLTHHFGNRLLPNKEVPAHTARYLELAQQFAGLHNLPQDQVWKAWEHGASKLFLNDLEYRFFEEMIARIRDIGYPGLVATSNFWGGMSLASLPSLTAGDVIDVHSYAKPGELFYDPSEESGFLDNIAAASVTGMPVTVTEWNTTGFPSDERITNPVRLAAMAAFQEWDAVMLYGYAQKPIRERSRSGRWHAANDPSLMGVFPLAALLYRQSQVSPAQTNFQYTPAHQDFYYSAISAETNREIRVVPENRKFSVALPDTPELPWLSNNAPVSDEVITQIPDSDIRHLALGKISSDTGEISRDFAAGVFTIDTDLVQVVSGSMSGETYILENAAFRIDNSWATVAVQSLEETPIRQSNQLLVSIVAPSNPLRENQLGFVGSPVNGTIEFRASSHLKIQATIPETAAANIQHVISNQTHVLRFENVPSSTWVIFK